MVNAHDVTRWKEDVSKSVDFYNNWFVNFAPDTYKSTRSNTAEHVLNTLEQTNYLLNVTPAHLIHNPSMLALLRMTTVPPLARDRLIGLAQVNSNLVKAMEVDGKIPKRMSATDLQSNLKKICYTLSEMIDTDIFSWVKSKDQPTSSEEQRAALIIADRLCGMMADPIIRNAQEKRQLSSIAAWLEKRGYKQAVKNPEEDITDMKPGTYSFRHNLRVSLGDDSSVNIPVDAIIQPMSAKAGDFPLLCEAKSAGDFTNTNKRRKEEAIKYSQLKRTYGSDVKFFLFLCGYFDSGYLGYEAAEGIDWVWEHRIDDLSQLGL